MKTAHLWWITGTLAFLLPAPSLADVDQNKLAKLVQDIRGIQREHDIGGMYSVAVSIPKDSYDLKSVEKPSEEQGKDINNGVVFHSKRLVIATRKAPEHAEMRVLNGLKLESGEGDLLVIFSYASACPENCANPKSKFNIIDKIKDVIKNGKWGDHVFVFEKVFRPGGEEIKEDELKTALRNLSRDIGLKNIFRCYQPKKKNFLCTSCSSGGDVTKECVDYDA